MPGGDWHLRFGVDGVVIVDDPEGGGANEGFQAAADGTLSLYGPANWVEAVARQGSFCDYAEGAVAMRLGGQGLRADAVLGRQSRSVSRSRVPVRRNLGGQPLRIA